MGEISPVLIFLGIMLGAIFMIGMPLMIALILSLFSRWFKFKKTDFKTALYSILIVFGIMITISSALSILFLDKIMQWQNIFMAVALLISFISGFFIILKFYKETIGKCLGVWILTCLTGLIFYVIIIIIILLILDHFL